MRFEVFGDPRTLGSIRPQWDVLASRVGSPYCSPLWMLAWWRHVAPADTRPRFVAAFEDTRLVGLAPFVAAREGGGVWTYRLLGAPTSLRIEPLAEEGRELDFAKGVAQHLARLRPFPAMIRLEGIASSSLWPRALRDGWPGAKRPTLHRINSMTAPHVSVAGSYEDWFAARTRNFRQQMRRTQRQLAAEGGVVQRARSVDDIRRALRELRRLHDSRWGPRGGSAVMSPRVENMLLDLAQASDGTGRHNLRIWTIHVHDRVISSQLFLSSGGEVSYWLGGFDNAWGAYRPSIVTILRAIEEAFERGDRRVDLGGGSQSYKMRFADGEDVLEWWAIVPPGRTSPAARAALAVDERRKTVAAKLPPDVKRRIKRLIGR